MYIKKPYDWLGLKDRAIVILHIGGFTHREIMKLVRVNGNRIQLALKHKHGNKITI